MTEPPDGGGAPGREETPDERADRNFSELLQELRVAQTGVQILFAFLLTLPFTRRFTTLSQLQTVMYGITLTAAAVALFLLVAPVVVHRVSFRMRMKEGILLASHRMTLFGLGFMVVSVVSAIWLAMWVAAGAVWGLLVMAVAVLAVVVAWVVVPVTLRRRNVFGR